MSQLVPNKGIDWTRWSSMAAMRRKLPEVSWTPVIVFYFFFQFLLQLLLVSILSYCVSIVLGDGG